MFSIREARIRLGMTQGEVAKLLDVTPTYISQMERGVRSPSKNMQKIIEAEFQKLGESGPSDVQSSVGQVAYHSPNAKMSYNGQVQGDLSRLLALAESQQQTIAAQQQSIATLAERLVALADRFAK